MAEIIELPRPAVVGIRIHVVSNRGQLLDLDRAGLIIAPIEEQKQSRNRIAARITWADSNGHMLP